MKTSLLLLAYTAVAGAFPITVANWGLWKRNPSPFRFTSTFSVEIKPEAVVDMSNRPTGGLPGTSGTFNYFINSHENVICFSLTLKGFRGEYQSPARTATHIHQAAVGQNGPPRIAFPNPQGPSIRRTSIGCLRGPFLTGVKAANGQDTGEGFHVRQIEQNPSAFFTDVHSSLAVPGAARGQLDARRTC